MKDPFERPRSIIFYPSDWLGDTALSRCSISAQGLWMRLLCIAHEGEPYGHVSQIPSDNPPPDPDDPIEVYGYAVDIAEKAIKNGTLTGAAQQKRLVIQSLVELIQKGVLSFTENGTIYSRRMVRDYHKKITARQNGSRSSGNPALTGGRITNASRTDLKSGRAPDNPGKSYSQLGSGIQESASGITPIPIPNKNTNGNVLSEPPRDDKKRVRFDSYPEVETEPGKIARAFLEARDRHWPNDPSFPPIWMTLLAQAKNLHALGLTAPVAAEALDRVMAKEAAQGRRAATGLTNYHRTLEAAGLAHQRATEGPHGASDRSPASPAPLPPPAIPRRPVFEPYPKSKPTANA